MSEVIKIRLRVKEIYLGDVIEAEEDISEAEWGLPLPVTLRDDELVIDEDDPEEEETFSHENDAPEDVEYYGAGLKLTGSFIKATRDQLATLLGGSVVGGKFYHSATKLVLTKAIKIKCVDGSEVIIPRARGYVNFSLSLGKSGVSKFPFKFKLLMAARDWDCDLVF